MPDNIVGLMIDRSIEMMVGLLGILKSGAAYLPIAPEYPEERIDYMLKDSHAKILIINKSEIRNSKLETNSNKTNSNDPNKNFEDMMVLDFKHLNLISQKGCPRRGLHHSKLAYIIYTSGSTGKPKGVIVQKEGFLNLLHWYIEELNITKEDNHLLIAPISFDLAQKNLFSPFLAGGCLTLAPAGIPDYRELTGIIHKSHITMINCAPSVFYPLVEINHDTGFTPLHSLRAVVLGGEPIRFDRLLPWVKTDSYHCELINTYGPTECTDIATSYRIPVKPFYPQEAIPIGRPISNVKVYILDKNLQILPVKIPGELCIGGIGLGQGYYNNKQLTGEKFIFVPHLPEKNVYRTGDLSRWLADGNIEFLGRIDHQVKIRGFRIELGEIENELLKHEEIKEAVVITRQGETGENYLCAYIVPRTERQIAISILREYLVHRLPDYMVPAYFVYLDAIPLTPSGKINRRGLPEPETRIEHYAAPRDQMETQLVKMWCDVLDNKNSSIAIGIDDNFFQLGGHSLKATILITKIHKTFDVKVPLSEVFKTPRIRELSGYIKNAVKWKYEQVELVEKKEYYVLSSAQKRLYFLYQVAPGDTGYNMPSAMLLEGDIEIQKLEEIFKHLIMIHESLRTTFHMIENEPAQRVHREVEFVVESKVFTGQSQPPEAIIKNFIRPFDLSEAPLLRAGLITLSEKEHILMIDIHHIAADGISMGVILNGFITLLNGGTLPGPKITYKDYVYRQYKQMAAGAFKKQETFWLQEFGDAIPVLNLPTDFSRPVVQSLEGDIQGFEINPLETGQLKRLCLERECSLFMGLLAIFNVFLGRLADQEDIVVGCIAAGRLSNELQNVVGMFVNTLPIRSYPYGEKTFSQFLPEVKEKTLAVFENQEYQFEELVEILPTKRDTGRNPLFDAALDVQETVFDFNKQSINLQGVKMKPYPYTHSAAKFDLVCHCENVGDRLLFTIEYACKLFKKNTIQRYCDYFQKILSQVIQQPRTLISEIDILSENEKKEILTDLNRHIDLFNVYPGHTIQQLFEAEVEKAPDHIALVGAAPRGCPDLSGHLVCLSYRELNEKSNRLAWSLRKKGIKPDHIVGIMMGPGIEMITTIFSVLKAGGIYLPVDPGYPAERAKFMLADCVAKCLLTTTGGAEPGPDQESKENPSCTNRPCDGAYVIFTSGTTGKPKGVMVEHRNTIALMKAGRELFGFCSRDVWTMFHSFCFDFSVWEMYGPLLHGGKLVTVPRLIAHEPQRYLETLKKKTVTILNQTPTVFYQLVQEEMQAPGKSLHLRYVIFGGEALKPGKLKPWKDKYPGTKLINMYGITETTVHVTFKEISGAEIEQNISNIGKPLPTLSGYIVNKYLKLQPKTVPGELLVGGHGVTRGYLNRPELTGEKFGRDFHHSSFIHHSKLYRTGDRVRLIDNGEMEYLGRIDHQVKVRGNRVETGEIERQMMLLPWIQEALVIPKEDDHGNNYLCAYMKVEPGKNITVTELRETLLKKLPDYMIPSYFIPLEVFPVTTTGKIDREKLPEPGSMRTRIGVTYAAPVTETEKTVAAVWQEVLKLDRVGIHDNFFDLGGTSLDIVRLNARLKGVFNLEIPVLALFEYPTIQAFSRRLEPGQAGAGDAAEEKAPGFNARIEKGKDKMKDRRQRLKIGMQ
ncbi:MAG TPA: amino acid adenylation domain-containing protein [Candidatus Deferrimicrobium sp.]|nr:amino acid adenylation domain-containing protein [Candidatus Deferrimicrobium sp.]